MKRERKPVELVPRTGSVLTALPAPRAPDSPIDLGRLRVWVTGEVGTATTRRVYQVRGADGAEYAYKEATDHELLAKEEHRTSRLAGRVPVARVLQSGPGWLLREWIQGPTGAAWLEQHLRSVVKQGHDDHEAPGLNLLRLFHDLARRQLLVSRLDPENVVWDDAAAAWVIVDCGKVKEGSAQEALTKYAKKLSSRWGLSLALTFP